jgi:hypothetical protein
MKKRAIDDQSRVTGGGVDRQARPVAAAIAGLAHRLLKEQAVLRMGRCPDQASNLQR